MSIHQCLPMLCKRSALLLLALLMSACATWTRIDSATQEGPGGKYRIQAPLGWVRFNLAKESIVITRDGLPIQYIEISQQSSEHFFKQTKVKPAPTVMPSDLAQMVIAEMRANKSLLNLAVKEIVPYAVAGQTGFKAHVQYRDERGTLFDRIVLGALKSGEVVTMMYHGLDTYYFSRDLETFYNVAQSFQT